MPPRQRRTLNFLSVGEQVRIERSCDFRLEDAFPPSDDAVPDAKRVAELCDAANECARLMEQDSREVHEAETDVKAMIDDWRQTDDQLLAMAAKVADIEFEHSPRIAAHAGRTTAAISQLRVALTTDANARVSRRCWECDRASARLSFMRRNTRKPAAEEASAACSICLARPLGAAFLPCGHCFCSECAGRAGQRCYMCRADIQRTTPLFY